jgi:anti-sigma regulatory factor (Ser/Thr protein kinase)
MATTITRTAPQTQHQEMCVLPGLPKSAPVARHWAVGLMESWGVADSPAAAAALGVSELVANAVVHGSCGVVVCRLALGGDQVRVDVHEWLVPTDLATSPRLAFAGDEAERGRGLLLVDALSRDWGWTPPESGSGNGSCVWALFGRIR